MFEVIENDCSDNLAAACSGEDEVAIGYHKIGLENEVFKEQGFKCMEQELAGLKKSASELISDRDSAKAELSSVVQYHGV